MAQVEGGGYREKDVNAVRFYLFDWTKLLDGDTISSSAFSSTPAGLTLSNTTNTTTTTRVKISGGVAETIYKVTNHVITAGGEEDDMSMNLKVLEE